METQRWLDPGFWAKVLRDTVEWALQATPKLLLVALGLFVTLKLIGVGLGKLRAYLVARHAEQSAADVAEHQKRLDTLMGIARRVAVISAWVLFGMLVLVQLGVNVGPLIAGAGVIGLAVGFGSQELVRDVISGFFMLVENQIRKGDVAVINGQGGLVENIGLRTITLRDASGTVHVFQNGKVNTLANMTKEWSAMVFDVGVDYREDPDEVCRVMKEVAEELRADPQFGSKILEPMEIYGVDKFTNEAVVIQGRIKTVPIEQWTVGREYRRRLKRAFEEHDIAFPFAQQTLYWGDTEGTEMHERAARGNGRDARAEPVRQ